MNIQIIGTKKSNETRKAERFFTERQVVYQFVDLERRGLSSGELENISRSTGREELLDTHSAAYQKRGLSYMDFDILEELANDPALLRLPVVRQGNQATVGYVPETWTQWLANR